MKLPPEQSKEDLRRMIARMQGTMSRMHGLLGLPGESFPDRWDACDRWCDEESARRLKKQKGRTFGSDDTDN